MPCDAIELVRPSHARYSPPAIRSAVNASGHRANTSARPSPAAVACDVLPTAAPAAARKPRVAPAAQRVSYDDSRRGARSDDKNEGEGEIREQLRVHWQTR